MDGFNYQPAYQIDQTDWKLVSEKKTKIGLVGANHPHLVEILFVGTRYFICSFAKHSPVPPNNDGKFFLLPLVFQNPPKTLWGLVFGTSKSLLRGCLGVQPPILIRYLEDKHSTFWTKQLILNHRNFSQENIFWGSKNTPYQSSLSLRLEDGVPNV